MKQKSQIIAKKGKKDMKKQYCEPELVIVRLENIDVICSSDCTPIPGGGAMVTEGD